MMALTYFLVLGALYAGSLADHANHCDKFHVQSYLFSGRTGLSVIKLGLLETEHKAGEIELSIGDQCESCEVLSRSKFIMQEGHEGTGEDDEKYRVALTEAGLAAIGNLTTRKLPRSRIPYQNHIIFRLAVDSGVTDGTPTVPNITEISFGGLVKCSPGSPRPITPICERRSACPSSLITYKPGGFDLKIPETDNRRAFDIKLEFTTDVEGLEITGTSKSIRRARLGAHKRCKNIYKVRVRRSIRGANQENEVTLSFNYTSGEQPVSQFISTLQLWGRRQSTRKCGYKCGEANRCPPTPATTPKPAPVATTTVKAPEVVTAAPTAPSATVQPVVEGARDTKTLNTDAVDDVLADEMDADDFDFEEFDE